MSFEKTFLYTTKSIPVHCTMTFYSVILSTAVEVKIYHKDRVKNYNKESCLQGLTYTMEDYSFSSFL